MLSKQAQCGTESAIKITSLILVYCTMKQLMAKLEGFFLALTLIEGCEFRRGLQIRPKSANPATGKFPA
jgi:hypothetical protein